MRHAAPRSTGARKRSKAMARKNRLVAEDAIYHVSSRIAHREFFLEDEGIKSEIVSWMYGIAEFCGIEVLAWNVMDNHLHIFLHVPTVPEEYWTDPDELPAASWRSMRPAECRAPRWTPEVGGPDPVPSPSGDSPSPEAMVKAVADGVPASVVPHPRTGFTIPDSEMENRLRALYYGSMARARGVIERWERLRSKGRGDEADAEKDAYCRRMYSVSQYMKTLKQRISEYFNRELGHAGQLWCGRFSSTLVEKEELAKLYVAAYVEWNAPKAAMVAHPRDWKWCSYSAACEGSERARKGYERLFGSWEEAKARLEAVFAERLPDSFGDEDEWESSAKRRMSQIIKRMSLRRVAIFSRRVSFVKETLESLPWRFPCSSGACVARLAEYDWSEPARTAA